MESDRKKFILDTSVLLYDKKAVHSFPGNDVVILEDVQLTHSGTLPRCVAQGKNLTVLYVDTVSGSIIKSRQINTDNPQSFATAKSSSRE